MDSRIALGRTLAASLTLATAAHANSDIEITAITPPDVRMLPGSSAEVSVIVANLGPDNAAPVLTTVIPWLNHGYTFSLSQPACGNLTQSGGIDVDTVYTLTLASMQAGQAVTCNFEVARDTTAFGASDLLLDFVASIPEDPNPANDYVDFFVGSLIDVSIKMIPKSFSVDDNGIAHEIEQLLVANHGPSNVDIFTVGACTDHGFPEFAISGDLVGGCGPADYQPGCFDYGFGFLVPTLTAGQRYECSIELTSYEPYEAPLAFGIYTGDLSNPDTLGGLLLDIHPSDNQAVLTLAPFSETIFADGFEG